MVELLARAAQDMVKNRRNAFSLAVRRAGKSKEKRERDDVAVMPEELHR